MPPVATVSLVQYVAAGVPAHSPVVSLQGLCLSAVGLTQVSEFSLSLSPSSLKLFIRGFLYFNGTLCSFCGFST